MFLPHVPIILIICRNIRIGLELQLLFLQYGRIPYLYRSRLIDIEPPGGPILSYFFESHSDLMCSEPIQAFFFSSICRGSTSCDSFFGFFPTTVDAILATIVHRYNTVRTQSSNFVSLCKDGYKSLAVKGETWTVGIPVATGMLTYIPLCHYVFRTCDQFVIGLMLMIHPIVGYGIVAFPINTPNVIPRLRSTCSSCRSTSTSRSTTIGIPIMAHPRQERLESIARTIIYQHTGIIARSQ